MGIRRPQRPADFAILTLLVKELFDYRRQWQGVEPLSQEEAEGTARPWCEQHGRPDGVRVPHAGARRRRPLSRVWLGNQAAPDFYLQRGYDLLNTIELRKDFTADRRGRPVRLLGRTLYLAANLPAEADD